MSGLAYASPNIEDGTELQEVFNPPPLAEISGFMHLPYGSLSNADRAEAELRWKAAEAWHKIDQVVCISYRVLTPLKYMGRGSANNFFPSPFMKLKGAKK